MADPLPTVSYVTPEAWAEMEATPVEVHWPFVERMRRLLHPDAGPDCA